MNQRIRITLLVMAVLVVLFAVGRIAYPGKAPEKLAAGNCDAALWDHVYDKERLNVIEPCTAVQGRVVSLHRGADGDLHISLDPEKRSVLNLFNRIHTEGKLVVEVVCDHPPTKASAITACSNFRSLITIPKPGDRIRVTGSYVTDSDDGWREIHPASKIEILP